MSIRVRVCKVDVSLRHACHVKRKWMSQSATPATASRGDQTRPSAPPSAMSATPATQNQGGCEIVPRVPGETEVDVVDKVCVLTKCVLTKCVSKRSVETKC